MDEVKAASATLETPEDAGQGKAGDVKRWLMAIHLSDKEEKNWRENVVHVLKRYRQEQNTQDYYERTQSNRFNILWSNTEVMRPVLYNSTPAPDVRRRFRDKDPVGKQSSEIIERGLAYTLDAYDFDHTMEMGVLDVLLPGRAVVRVKYDPTIETVTPEPEMPEAEGFDELGNPFFPTDELGEIAMIQPEPYDEITDQSLTCELVHWDDFRRGPGKKWSDVPWIAFRLLLTKTEVENQFSGEIANKLKYEYEPEEDKKDEEDYDLFKRALVWEIWDKDERKVKFIAPCYKGAPIKEEDDPLSLQDFFPIPRPLYAVESSDSLVPIEPYRLYKDQADELDKVTRRIDKLVDGLKVRGIYDSTLGVMERLMNEGDNILLPASDEALILLQQGGSLDKAIWMMPIERQAQVLLQLYQQRDQIKQTIYEITGLSDIIRGSTDPNETLGAQQLKAQTGSQRLRRLQREVQRFARDILRIKAEIISEHFQPEVLEMMTGQQVTPEIVELLRSDVLREYRIDIETDSTVLADEQADQEALTKILDGITRYVSAVGPVVQQGFIQPQVAVDLLGVVLRRFKLGRKMEDMLDEASEELQGQQPKKDPKEDAEAQKAQLEIQQGQAELEMKQAEFEQNQQMKEAEFQADQERKDREFGQSQRRLWAETESKIAAERARAESQIETARMKANQRSA